MTQQVIRALPRHFGQMLTIQCVIMTQGVELITTLRINEFSLGIAKGTQCKFCPCFAVVQWGQGEHGLIIKRAFHVPLWMTR